MGMPRKGVAKRNRVACGLCKPWRRYGNGKDRFKGKRSASRDPLKGRSNRSGRTYPAAAST